MHNMPPAPTNPIKEIIREIHQVHVPQPAPQPQPQSEDTARLIAALGQAVAQNQNLVGFAQKMGLSMDQLVALLRAQLKRPEEAMMSSPPGPPPPPSGGYGPVKAAQKRPEVYQIGSVGRDASRPPPKKKTGRLDSVPAVMDAQSDIPASTDPRSRSRPPPPPRHPIETKPRT